MVRAILEGRKTQTRRVVKPQPTSEPFQSTIEARRWHWRNGYEGPGPSVFDPSAKCPYSAGDRLWVRETWAVDDSLDMVRASQLEFGGRRPVKVHWLADGPKPKGFGKSRPGIFLPREAPRLFLSVTDVDMERLQDIDEEAAKAEGMTAVSLDWSGYTKRAAFRDLWDGINGKRAPFASNPWVWVISFVRAEK